MGEAIVVIALVAMLLLVLPICSFCCMMKVLGALRRMGEEVSELKRELKRDHAAVAPAAEVAAPGEAVENVAPPEQVASAKSKVIAESDVPAGPIVVAEPVSAERVMPSLPDLEAVKAEERMDEPNAVEVFFDRIADWIAVKGDFAPKGTTREFAVATRWLVRAGLTMLVASVIYFVKLSIDQGWMGPVARVIGTVFWGAVGVVGGVALVRKTRYGILGHALAALGFIALYMGFGLGHKYFDPPVIESAVCAFAALAMVTVAMGVVSVMLPSSMIAVMGLLGGYLVPVVAGHDTGSPLGWGIYLLLLNLGAFAVARRRAWSALDFLAAMLAYVAMWGWCDMHSGRSSGATLMVFGILTLLHALYMASVVVGAKQRGRVGNALAWSGLSINALVYLGWLGVEFRHSFSDSVTGLVFLGLVAAYLLVAYLARERGWLDGASVDILLVFALVFLALSPLLIFSAPWCVVSWSLTAVAAIEAERRTHERVLGVLATLFLVAAAVAGLFVYAPGAYLELGVRSEAESNYAVELLLRMVRLWTLPLAVGWVGWRKGPKAFLAVASVFAFLFLTGEAHRFGLHFMPKIFYVAVTVVWTLAAIGCIFGGIRARARAVRMAGLGIICAAVVKLLLFDTAGLSMPARAAVFALVGVLLMVGAFLYLKFKASFEEKGGEDA